jgi:UDP-2-acetamido-3-amino-2,3-dideoxy-glucuronate N-acetyltransferase
MLPYIVTLETKRNAKPGALIMLEKSTIGIDVKRIFYIYDLSDDPLKNTRGSHGHTNTHQFLICVRGTVEIDTVHRQEHGSMHFTLQSPDTGLMLPPNNFIVMRRFSPDAILMVACDTEFKDEIAYGKEDS